MAECIHEIELAACGFCTPREPAARDNTRFGPWFAARLETPCDGDCDGLIEPGDMIRSDGAGGWLCDDCGRTPAELAPDVPGLW
jgi:hypothetical protein